jgi:acetyltransferase-like isoleucine patch superfamily enzyme
MFPSSNKIRKLSNNVVIGEFSYIGDNCSMMNVTIGKFCSIASDVKIGLGKHPTNTFISTFPAFYAKNNSGCKLSFVKEQLYEEFQHIEIGNDVWIGTRVLILDGVKIGNGAIIGANAVVTKDIPAYAVVGGVPAKIIKYRFPQEQILKLENFKWWDKPIKWIIANANSFSSELFFQKMETQDFIDDDYLFDENKYFSDNDIIINNQRNLEFSKAFNNFYNFINKINSYDEKYIIYGNGTVGKTIRTLIPNKIIDYVDIADEKHHPLNLKNLKYDKIIISVLGRENEIIKYLVEEINIEIEKIIILDL